MRLSAQDKSEMLKAALDATLADDLKGLVGWLRRLIDASDDLPQGKYDAGVPPYVAPGAPVQRRVAAPPPAPALPLPGAPYANGTAPLPSA